MDIKCNFELPYIGHCDKVSEKRRCPEHENLICVSCGNEADTKCDAQVGGLMCGFALCDKCNHDHSDIWKFRHISKDRICIKCKSEYDEVKFPYCFRCLSDIRISEGRQYDDLDGDINSPILSQYKIKETKL